MNNHLNQPPPHSVKATAPIVGIGASTGSLEALKAFFEYFPVDLSLAFVVLQQDSQEPYGNRISWVDSLKCSTSLPVEPVHDGMIIESGRVYWSPPGYQLTIRNGAFCSHPIAPEYSNRVIDCFFESLAAWCGSRSIGILLSRTGSDGTEGLRNICEAGGMVMARNQGACSEPMNLAGAAIPDISPRNGIVPGIRDVANDTEEVASLLRHYIQRAPQFRSSPGSLLNFRPARILPGMISRLRQKAGILRFHRPGNTGPVDWLNQHLGPVLPHLAWERSHYPALVQASGKEITLLYRDVLASLHSFFRNPGLPQRARTELEHTVADLETANRELKSRNKDEARINRNLHRRLDQAFSDLDSRLNSINSAILFLDAGFRIRLYTNSSETLFDLSPADIGRPLSEVGFRVDDNYLLEDARQCLETGETLEIEVPDSGSNWYLRHLSLYRATPTSPDGVVVTYTDISHLKSTQSKLADLTHALEQQVSEATEALTAYVKETEQATRERDVFFKLSSLPFFVMTADGYFHRLNSAWRILFGWSIRELSERPYLNFIHREERDLFRQRLADLDTEGKSTTFSTRFRARNGRYVWLEWRLEAGREGIFLGVAQDVSERRQAALAVRRARDELEQQVSLRTEQLQAEKELARVMLMAIGEAVITTDTNGRVTSMNPIAERMTGWTAGQTLASTMSISDILQLRHEETGEPLSNPVTRALRERETVTVPETAELIGRDGTRINVGASVSPFYDNQGELEGAVAILFDVSNAREMTRRVRHRASHDDLTGLLNRGEMESRLNSAVTSARGDGKEHALLFMDLDRFKTVNDTCGHLAGDELLRQIADEFQHHIRQRDTLARLGGDEFALLLENCNDEQATRIANDILTFIRDFRFIWEAQTFRLGISIGIALIDATSESVRQVLQDADSACYRAKEAGRDQVCLYSRKQTDNDNQQSCTYWAERLSRALEQDTLVLMRQPIQALSNDPCGGASFEILTRLAGEDNELILPERFFKAAERYNLMPRLDQHVISKVLAWLSANPDILDNLDTCAINLSAGTLADTHFSAFLEKQLALHKVPAPRICFEISEAIAVRDLSHTTRLAGTLTDMGFRLSIDDFGSSFAPFHQLRRLPAEFFKIDGGFIQKILQDPMNEALVRSMNEISHILGKRTIAGHVESGQILEKVRQLGIDYAQGFGTGRPQPLFQAVGKNDGGPPEEGCVST